MHVAGELSFQGLTRPGARELNVEVKSRVKAVLCCAQVTLPALPPPQGDF